MRGMQVSPTSFASVLKDVHRCITDLSQEVVRLSEEHEREIAGLSNGVEGIVVVQPKASMEMTLLTSNSECPCDSLEAEEPVPGTKARSASVDQEVEATTMSKATSSHGDQAVESHNLIMRKSPLDDRAINAPRGHVLVGESVSDRAPRKSVIRFDRESAISASGSSASTMLPCHQDEEVPPSRKSVIRFDRESAISASGSSARSTVLSCHQDEEVPPSRKSVIRFDRESAISALSGSTGRSTVLSCRQDEEVPPFRKSVIRFDRESAISALSGSTGRSTVLSCHQDEKVPASRKSVIRFDRESAIRALGSSGRSTVLSCHQDEEVLASRKSAVRFNRDSASLASGSASTVSFCNEDEEFRYDDLEASDRRKEVTFRRMSEWSTRTSMMTTNSDDDQEIIIQVLPVWTDEQAVNSSVVKIRAQIQRPSSEENVTGPTTFFLDRLVASPDSLQRLVWDVLGMVIIVYDLIFIPMQVFDIKPSIITDFLSWFTTTYWTLDIPTSFLVGYHTQGVVELRTSKIAPRYVKSWFAFDVSVVSVDWLVSTVKTSDNAGVKSSLLLRVLRMVRLLRLFKVIGFLDEVLKRIQSEWLHIIIGIVNLLIFILLTNHIIACAWFWVGERSEVLFGDSWITKNMVEEADVGYQYTTALHWSLTQFTPASMEVVPRNTLERAYNVITLLFAMVTFSSFVSSITNAMTRLRHLNSQWMEEQSVLQQYLKENRISSNLTRQICSFLQKSKRSKGRKIHTQDVVMLDRLSKTLQDSLRSEVYSPILEVHPFFRCFNQVYPDGMQRIYRFAMEESTVTCDQELFRIGELAECVHFVIKGAFRYTLSGGILDDSAYSVIVDAGGWLCEHALWIDWRHCGQLVAAKHSEVVDVKASKFQTIVRRELIGVLEPCKYAMLFAEYVDELAKSRKLTDIISDYDMIDEIAKEAWAAVMSKRDSVQMLRRKSKFKDMLMKHARRALNHLSGNSQ